MLEICVPESKIELVQVEWGMYHVRYWSGRQVLYDNPPKSVTEFMKKTPTKEHMTCKYNGRTWEWDLYRNYKMKEE